MRIPTSANQSAKQHVLRRHQRVAKCKKCGGSDSAIADDYFIRKCWCNEFQTMEGDDTEESEGERAE